MFDFFFTYLHKYLKRGYSQQPLLSIACKIAITEEKYITIGYQNNNSVTTSDSKGCKC